MAISFYTQSALLGLGLAMDAFSVSLANGLREPQMPRRRMLPAAGVYAGFQFLMPLLGWLCVHTIVELFSALERLVPWIALILLAWIGGSMLLEGLRERQAEGPGGQAHPYTGRELLVQGLATSIDALSVGFTIERYSLPLALQASGIIALVTFNLCLAGLTMGTRMGTRFSRYASLLGGIILVGIGFKIFLEGVF